MSIFSSAVFQRKSRYCHHSCVVGCGGVVVVVVVTNFNLGYYFVSVEANLMKLHMLVHHLKGYNLTKDHISARLLCPFIDMQNGLCVDYRSVTGVSIVWHVC